MTPNARKNQLVIQEIGDETLIYDEKRSHVHRLNQTAGLVWQHCDGQRTVADLAGILQTHLGVPVTEDVVWLALDRLEKENLLEEKLTRPDDAARITRRQVLRKAALVGGISLLLPVVQSIVAPTPAMAMSISCAKRGQPYSLPTHPCCSGLFPVNGVCVDRGGQR